MAYRANNDEPPPGFGCDGYQFIKGGAAKEFFFHVVPNSRNRSAIRSNSGRRVQQRPRTIWNPLLQFRKIRRRERERACLEPSRYRRRNVDCLNCRVGEIRSANDRRFVFFFTDLALFFGFENGSRGLEDRPPRV